MSLPIQKALEGKYEILEKIGEGGIGSVYKVKHRLLEEVRVIKVLRPQAATKEDLQERFLHEARMAIRMKQANIAQLHDFSVTPDGTAYIVMEFIDGVDVDSLLRACGPPSVDLALEISRQALNALGYLHAHRFVHRDVSPDNLMLTRDFDGSPLAKLIDLGIAKNLEGEMQLTATGVFVGKVRYSSPEQFSAQGGGDELDHRSDLYSFGVMLYELLTGEMPVGGESFSEVAGGHLFHPPRPFDDTDPDGRVSDGLRRVVLKALEKEPDKRYASADDLIADLEPFRDTKRSLKKEAGELLDKTTAALPRLGESKEPGSTQNRLDAEFGLMTTPSPMPLEAVDVEATTAVPADEVSSVVAGIGKFLATGKLDRAEKALGNAVAQYGEVEALLALHSKLAAARGSSGSAQTPDPRVRLGLAIAAAAVLVAALSAWFMLGRKTPAEEAVAADRVQIEVSPRWAPASGELGDDLFSNRPFPPPPPFEEQQLPPPTVAQQQRPRPGPGAAGGSAPQPPPPQGGAPSQRPGPGPGERPPLEQGRPQGGPPPLAQRTNAIYTAGSVGVVPPVLLELPPVVFPFDKPPKKDVVVVVRVLVDELGKPTSPSIEKGRTLRRRVRDTAVEVALGARFQAATKNSVAGRMWTEVQVVFPGSE